MQNPKIQTNWRQLFFIKNNLADFAKQKKRKISLFCYFVSSLSKNPKNHDPAPENKLAPSITNDAALIA